MATTAQLIKGYEKILKDKYSHTPEMLEKLGLDCLTSLDYMENLWQKLNELGEYDDGRLDDNDVTLLKEVD